jgi:hypothetical protein
LYAELSTVDENWRNLNPKPSTVDDEGRVRSLYFAEVSVTLKLNPRMRQQHTMEKLKSL